MVNCTFSPKINGEMALKSRKASCNKENNNIYINQSGYYNDPAKINTNIKRLSIKK